PIGEQRNGGDQGALYDRHGHFPASPRTGVTVLKRAYRGKGTRKAGAFALWPYASDGWRWCHSARRRVWNGLGERASSQNARQNTRNFFDSHGAFDLGALRAFLRVL